MDTKWIVVYDPKGEWWEGSLVDQTRAQSLQSRNVVVLPVVPDLFKRSGVGGYHKRAWGSGWSLDSSMPRTVSPMTIYCSKDLSAIHWAARILPEPGFLDILQGNEEKPALLNGFIRVVSDGSQAIAAKVGLLAETYVDVRDLKKDQLVDGAFLLRGKAKVTVPGDGHYGFALYGYAPGLRVLWSAVSQAFE
jgi:hypothetical protein